MILPAKHIAAERSIMGIGAEILSVLENPKTVSETWIAVRRLRSDLDLPLTFDWFVMALSWLYAVSAVRLEDDLLRREERK